VKIKPGMTDFLWMAAGAVTLLVVILVVMHFHTNQSPAEQLAFKARRVDLVERMRVALASASEAEKSAVMAVTDRESLVFADQARAAAAEVEQERQELEQLLVSGGTQPEKDDLAKFSGVFAKFQTIDKELLALAVKNTNIKANTLAFGPAADALTEMDTALSHLVAKNAGSADAKNVAVLAFGAQTAALRIQTLLAPHIAEESDKKMDDFEAMMAKDDQEVRKDLDGLATLLKPGGDPDLNTATSAYARFGEIRTRILALSRENTNVRSLVMSLDQKRKIMFVCQDALATLQRTILEEPIAGVNYGLPENPRQLEAVPRNAP